MKFLGNCVLVFIILSGAEAQLECDMHVKCSDCVSSRCLWYRSPDPARPGFFCMKYEDYGVLIKPKLSFRTQKGCVRHIQIEEKLTRLGRAADDTPDQYIIRSIVRPSSPPDIEMRHQATTSSTTTTHYEPGPVDVTTTMQPAVETTSIPATTEDRTTEYVQAETTTELSLPMIVDASTSATMPTPLYTFSVAKMSSTPLPHMVQPTAELEPGPVDVTTTMQPAIETTSIPATTEDRTTEYVQAETTTELSLPMIAGASTSATMPTPLYTFSVAKMSSTPLPHMVQPTAELGPEANAVARSPVIASVHARFRAIEESKVSCDDTGPRRRGPRSGPWGLSA